jgi:hypothetical protein
MMRILHFYQAEDTIIAQHVAMLQEGMGLEAENHMAAQTNDARTLLQGSHYDILHVHGCWRNASRSIVRLALRQGCRLVITPHGQLEPWIQEDNYWQEKLPKRVLYQQALIRQAYAVIIQGNMEQECMERLGWNKRLVTIRNCVITSSISKTDMARQTFKLYQKVMDTNTWELLTAEMRQQLKTILMAGITGDVRWLPQSAVGSLSPAPSLPWRELLLYAHHEQITDTLQRGLRILHIEFPEIDVEQIDHFWPEDYQEAPLISPTIGNQFASENDRLLASFRVIRKLISNGQFSIKHLIELDRELRQYSCEEEELGETLKERQLWKLARRTMQVMADRTGLTIGFMPVAPLDDYKTRSLKRQIDNHLKL